MLIFQESEKQLRDRFKIILKKKICCAFLEIIIRIVGVKDDVDTKIAKTQNNIN